MFALTYAAAILAVAFAVAAVALLYTRRTLLDFALAGYLLSAAIWIGGNAIADVSYTSAILILSSDWAFFGGILTLFFVLLLVDLLIDVRFPPLHHLAWYGVPCMILAFLGFTPYGITGASFPPNEPAQILPGILYTIALFFYLFGLGYGIVRLILGLRQEIAQTRRLQFLYLLTGLLVVMLAQMVFDVLLPLLGELRFFELGPFMSIVFAACCGYAIIRHKLLDIRIAVQRGIIYSLVLVLILSLYVSLVATLSEFLRISMSADVFWSGGCTVLVSIFGIPFIERYFRRISDPLFFKETYDYADAMHQLSTISQVPGDFNELVTRMEETLARVLRSKSVHISLNSSGSDPEAKTLLLEEMRIPISIDNLFIGEIIVGEKRSGEPYTKRDMTLLTTFSAQAATALSRVRLYKEVEHHAEELEQKVEARTTELRNLQEKQRQMLIDISHNLQTPLTVFRAKIDHLRSSLPDDSEIQGMEHSVISLSDFIYDLLALSSLERTLEREERSSFNMSLLVDDFIEELSVITAENTTSIRSNIEPSLMIHGNKKRIREVLMNLANNSLKYMGETVHGEIHFSLTSNPSSICLVVGDTGIGISLADLPHVFERFYRGSRTDSSSSVAGTGLGLSIVKQIIEQHSGSISLESELGVGTTVHILFPV
jgi:signal transduction histidine kinase